MSGDIMTIRLESNLAMPRAMEFSIPLAFGHNQVLLDPKRKPLDQILYETPR